jgi:hypothetical protein
MSITLHLPPDIEATLLAEAEARGMRVDNLVEEFDAIRQERDLSNLGQLR